MWNATISSTANNVIVWFVENSMISGATISTTVPRMCATPDARGGDGRRSFGKFLYSFRLSVLLTMIGAFDIMTGTTLVKWWPNFETPAPTQITIISSLHATIMSVKGSAAKNTTAGRYCSARMARKVTLSRKPMTTARTSKGHKRTGFNSPAVASGCTAAMDVLCTPGSTRITTRLRMTDAYSATSYSVRTPPLVKGTLPGHGGLRKVPDRSQ